MRLDKVWEAECRVRIALVQIGFHPDLPLLCSLDATALASVDLSDKCRLRTLQLVANKQLSCATAACFAEHASQRWVRPYATRAAQPSVRARVDRSDAGGRQRRGLGAAGAERAAAGVGA